MKTDQEINERDSAIITILLSSVPRSERGEAAKKLRDVFAEGHKFWLELKAQPAKPEQPAPSSDSAPQP